MLKLNSLPLTSWLTQANPFTSLGRVPSHRTLSWRISEICIPLVNRIIPTICSHLSYQSSIYQLVIQHFYEFLVSAFIFVLCYSITNFLFRHPQVYFWQILPNSLKQLSSDSSLHQNYLEGLLKGRWLAYPWRLTQST